LEMGADDGAGLVLRMPDGERLGQMALLGIGVIVGLLLVDGELLGCKLRLGAGELLGANERLGGAET
jgi:hypothetical protein